MTPEQRKALQLKINKTLKLFENEETYSTSQAFDIIRWARQGYLNGGRKMTERKWTPGPWRVGNRYMSIVADSDTGHDDAESIRAYGGHLVCESAYERNAHLIAAAPELYDALDASLMYLECCCDPDGSDPASEVLAAARAALAKARGEK